MTAPVQRPTPGNQFVDVKQRVKALEGTIGRWVYVNPVAPATPPDDYVASDSLSPTFVNSWGNVANEQPVSFRIHPASRIQVRGAIDGGVVPSVVFTLPVGYRPMSPAAFIFPSLTPDTAFTGRIDTNGEVSITGIVAGTGSGSVVFDIANTGASLAVTTSAGTSFTNTTSTGGLTFTSQGGGGTFFNDDGAGGTFFNDNDAGGVYFNIAAGGSDGNWEVDNHGDGQSIIKGFGSGSVVLQQTGSGNIELLQDGSGYVVIRGLPLVNPGGTNRLWNNGGAVSVT